MSLALAHESDAAEDKQAKHNTADCVKLLHGLCGLSYLPPEGQQVHIFMVIGDKDSATPYPLPIKNTEDILKEISDKISPQLGMQPKKIKLLWPYQCVRGRRYYKFDGKDTTPHLLLPQYINVLTGMCSYDALVQSDEVFT